MISISRLRKTDAYATAWGSGGFRKSSDFGLTWTPVTSSAFNAEMNAMITNVANNNIEMAVHPTTGRLYVGILLSGQLRGVFYSDNASTASPTWTKMDVPILPIGAGVAITGASNTNPITITSASAHGLSNGQFVAVNGVLGNTAANGIFTINVTSPTQFSLVGSVGNGGYTSGGVWTRVVTPNPSIKNIDETGAQGRIHFSIVVDPTDQNIVYVGGDRQEQPSSIGDTSFNAAIFRGNTAIASNPSVVPSPQWDHITHDSVAFDPPSGTASGSAPHADSREMVFNANGNLIETNDGGIFKRTNPRNNTGDWFSLVGDIGVTEVHDVAYDRLSDTLFIGTQDNGTHSQATAGSKVFNFFSGGDGGDVEIDNNTLASSGQSIRYSSSQNLGGFLRSTWSASGGLVAASFPARTVVSGAAFTPAFRTPVELNAIDPTRLIIQGSNSAYESLDQGETLTEVSVGNGVEFVDQNAIAYGGRKNGIDNEDVLWVGSFSTVSVRTAGTGPTAPTSSQPSVFGTIRDLTIDPDDWASAFLVDEANQVFATDNTGASWSNITGNLPTIGNVFWSVVYVASAINDAIVVGTNLGVFATKTSTLGTWFQLGALLPHAAVYDLAYDDVDDVLVAGTLGRGAWNLMNASDAINFVAPVVTIAQAYVFYNDSGYENFGGVSTAIDNVGKQLLRSNGLAQTTAVSNVSNYINGINGLVFDVNNLAAASLTASDFVFRMRQNTVLETANPISWANAPAPTVVNVTPGAPSRIRLEWPNNAIQNTWLQVILRANSNTGLTNPVVFYIGHVAGEGAGLAPYRVGVAELSAIQAAVNSVLRPITDVRDVDKSRRVGVSDLSFVQSHVSSSILLDNIMIPIAGSAAEGAPPPGEGFGSLFLANEGNGYGANENGMAFAVPPVDLSSTLAKKSTTLVKLTPISASRFQPSFPTKTPVPIEAAMSKLFASGLTSVASPSSSVESIDEFFKSFNKNKC